MIPKTYRGRVFGREYRLSCRFGEDVFRPLDRVQYRRLRGHGADGALAITHVFCAWASHSAHLEYWTAL